MTKLGIQISSLRDYLQTPEDVTESFKKVSEIGYQFIQIQWINPEIPRAFIQAALKENKLKCLGTQDRFDDVVENLDTVILDNALWGGTYVTVSGIPDEYHSYKGILDFCKELNRLSKYVEMKGMILAFHPRSKDVFDYSKQNSLEIIFENTRPEMQFLLDIYQIISADLDPIAWIHKVKGRNDLIHFKDGTTLSSGQEILKPIGKGSIDWKPIFEATLETDIHYAFAEQETFDKEPFTCLKESYDYLTEHNF